MLIVTTAFGIAKLFTTAKSFIVCANCDKLDWSCLRGTIGQAVSAVEEFNKTWEEQCGILL
jgi:hypothetical protein